MSRKRRLVIALAAAGGLAGCAAGEGVPISPGRFDGNTTLATLSGAGIIPQEKEKIDYRPRAPIALPKNGQLPQPQDPTAAASRNPAWPEDPDARRKRQEEEYEALSIEERRRRAGVSHNSRDVLMSEEEAQAGRRASAGRPSGPVVDRRDDDVFMLPSEYERKKTARDIEREQRASQGAEPKRRYLTEPPTGYRAPVAGKTPEGQKAAQEALKARREQKPGGGGIGSWLGL